MARRIVRPSRPPYALIAFIVLTVGCATGLGIFASMYLEARQRAAGEARLRKAAGAYDPVKRILEEEKQDNLIDLFQRYRELAELYKDMVHKTSEQKDGDGHTEQGEEQLSQSINNDIADCLKTLDAARAALLKSLKLADGASPDTSNMKAAVEALTTRIKELDGQLQNKEKLLAGKQSEIELMQAKIRTQVEASKNELDKVLANLKREQENFRAHITKDRTEYTALEEDRNDAIRKHQAAEKAWERRKQKLAEQADGLRGQIKELATQLARFRIIVDVIDIDGNVREVSEAKKTAYISLAKGDGIILGMTFAVYSPEEIGREAPKPKASVRVVRIMEHVSEARIFNVTGLTPVMKGDIIANPVYDKERRFHFALVGMIDLDNDGRNDIEKVKVMISSFGGVADREIAVQTDFLIVGEEPRMPIAVAAEEMTPQAKKAYEKARKAFIEYNRALVMAKDYAIPTLTANRFLNLVGADVGGEL